jgi:AraC-like DNA-binding protein
MRNLAHRARASVRRATAPGGVAAKLDVAESSRCDRIGELAPPGEIAEAAALLSRLAYYSRMDSVMCRAAWHLRRDPALPLQRLASRLGVSEGYLSSGLRKILGVNPNRLARLAHIAGIIGHGA